MTKAARRAAVRDVKLLSNTWRGAGLSPQAALADIPFPAADPAAPLALLARCPRAGPTPLVDAAGLAREAGIATLMVKDERTRMGLGSFKALGAAHVIAADATEGKAAGRTYVTASAGNHGMSVAAGAAAFGARARIYIAETVPESFAARLRGLGAEVVRHGAIYEDSMKEAARAAEAEGLELLSDSSWPGYVARPYAVMEGYLVLMAEVAEQIADPPTHIFVQAGVGGLAAAVAVYARRKWGDLPRIVVVEPEFAPALFASIQAGKPVVAPGPESIMGRLDCKEPSLIALKGLARDADIFALITEEDAKYGAAHAAAHGLASTPSGAAGIAALLAAGSHRDRLGLGDNARVLCILSETGDG